jgi:aspartyl-tRNA synthetase
MYRTHHCGELRLTDCGRQVKLSGWIHKVRNLGAMTFADLRDRYGITQLTHDEHTPADLLTQLQSCGREFVVMVTGIVRERESKNQKIPTGEIEIAIREFRILNESKVPPFTIEEETDGGDELRMRYRYLDIRRAPVRESLILRHQLAKATRNYLDEIGFIEVETPVLIKSTPEGARDFVVPSRMNPGQFYALPQSPQTFKQLLMVAGIDKYYQLVKCFRDEDLRADRQPEFTQIDCEMSFVEQEDILSVFEGLVRHLFKTVKGIELSSFPRMTYSDAMKYYGNDKPDIRFDMKISDISSFVKGKGFKVFDEAELVAGIVVPGAADYTRKQLDEITDWVKRPQIGASGLVYSRMQNDGTIKSSVDKFFDEAALREWALIMKAAPGDLILVLAGSEIKTRKALSELRLEMGARLGLRAKNTYACLWVTDFPLLEFNEEEGRWFAMHHPFTSPQKEDIALLNSGNYINVRANAYDMVINGVEVGGGSVRIHDKSLQSKMFNVLGFSAYEAEQQFGFLMNAFEYGAPPHAGIAFGFDRLCSLFGGADSIRDFIAFPKNNAGRDVMIDCPSEINPLQLRELGLQTNVVK